MTPSTESVVASSLCLQDFSPRAARFAVVLQAEVKSAGGAQAAHELKLAWARAVVLVSA